MVLDTVNEFTQMLLVMTYKYKYKQCLTERISWFIVFDHVEALYFMRGMNTKQFYCLQKLNIKTLDSLTCITLRKPNMRIPQTVCQAMKAPAPAMFQASRLTEALEPV